MLSTSSFVPLVGPLWNSHSFRTKIGPERRKRVQSCAQTLLPESYEAMRRQATDAALRAVNSGEPLIELCFPAVPNMATAALNQLLDANRAYAKQFLLACRTRLDSGALHAVFQDAAEAKLARKAYGDVPFSISSLPKPNAPSPPFISQQGSGIIAVVQPGFNVDEWMAMERLQGNLPIVAINADLDKVRGAYYPRLFYPGLHAVKTRFLSRFNEAYYIKIFSNGGVLFRSFPDAWRLFYSTLEGKSLQIWSGNERPQFVEIERILAQSRQDDILSQT